MASASLTMRIHLNLSIGCKTKGLKMGEEADADWEAGMLEAGREYVENNLRDKRYRAGYRDPTCAKCGIVLGNRMSYACRRHYCPAGLN